MRMGLREANQRFSQAIKAIKAGHDVVLTERGKPIAVMKPLHNDGNKDEVISRLEAEGFLLAAANRAPMPRWRGRSIKGRSMAETVSEERDHR